MFLRASGRLASVWPAQLQPGGSNARWCRWFSSAGVGSRYPLKTLLGGSGASSQVGQIGFGGHWRLGARLDATRSAGACLQAGGNIVEVLPGLEREVYAGLQHAMSEGDVERNDVLLCANLPISCVEANADAACSVVDEKKAVKASVNSWFKHLVDRLAPGLVDKPRIDCVLIDVDVAHALDQEQVLTRLALLFDRLQKRVKKGEIGGFGVSSYGFSLPSDHPRFLSFDRIIELAHDSRSKVSSPTPGLQYVRTAFNLLNPGLLTVGHGRMEQRASLACA